MEGIINLENIFEEEENEQEGSQLMEYKFDLSGITLKLMTRKLHIGVSRSVWKASIVLSQYLEKYPQILNIPQCLKVLELGSGPGLGGLFASAFLKRAQVYMTDICVKSLQLMKENIKINQELISPTQVSVNYLEWGNHQFFECEYNDDKGFPSKEFEGSFDLIIASDVVYMPECLQALLDSIRYFMNRSTGKCLLVNNKIRQDLFIDKFDQLLQAAQLNKMSEEEIKFDNDIFKVFILQ